MDVRGGYKQTELGVIPDDWEVKQIGEFEPFVTSGSRGWARFYSDVGSPFLRITNLSRTCIYPDLRDLRLVKVAANDGEAARTQLRDGDVLVSITADIGIVGHVIASVPKPAYINQHLALVRFDARRISPRFVTYFLASEKPQKLFRALTDSGAKAGMNLATVQQILIAVPPSITAQEAIAEALSDADAHIESLEQLLAKKRRIKQGAMQELLTGRTRLPGFEIKPGYKQSEVGMIPEDWTAMSFIQAVGSYIDYRGRTPRKLGLSWGGGDILALSANNVQMGRIDSDGEAYRGSEGLYSRWMVHGECEPGDVLLTMEAPLGNVAQIPDSQRYILSQRVLLIKPKKWLHRDFLAHYMRGAFFQKQLSLNSTGSTAKGIQRRKLDDLPIGLPVTKAEQEAIAETLNDVDAEIAVLEAKLAKAQTVKQGMMQELLTGRIRLV